MKPILGEYTGSSKMHGNVAFGQDEEQRCWIGASMYCEGRSYELALATRVVLAGAHGGRRSGRAAASLELSFLLAI